MKYTAFTRDGKAIFSAEGGENFYLQVMSHMGYSMQPTIGYAHRKTKGKNPFNTFTLTHDELIIHAHKDWAEVEKWFKEKS